MKPTSVFKQGCLLWYRLYSAGRDSSDGIETCYGLDGAGIESLRERFSAPLQTGPGVLSASFAMRTGLFRGGKAARASRWPPTQSSTQLKERLDLYSYSPSAPSWPILVRNLPLTLPLHSVRYKTQPKDQTSVNPRICTAVKGCPSVAVDTHNICWSFLHKFAVLLQFCCLPFVRKSSNCQHEFFHKAFMWLRVCFGKRSVAPLEWIH